MFNLKISLFSQTKSLENKIDLFHDKLLEVSLTFKKAIKVYLKESRSKNYTSLSKQIKSIEHEADCLRREIENKLYAQNLIPDLRADVLNLVESLDKIINGCDEVAYKFYVEQPQIDLKYHERLIELCNAIADCTENTAMASRAFFKDISSVRDFSQKVYFIEHETDILSGHLKEEVFASDIELANKLQLRDLINAVANIADIAEDCIDELSIFAIKRDI